MSKFEQHIRAYYSERLGGYYLTVECGFAAYRIRDGVFYVDDIFIERGATYRHGFDLARRLFKLARDCGCTHLCGANDPTLDTYEDIKKLHKFFGMTNSGQLDGHRELWLREL